MSILDPEPSVSGEDCQEANSLRGIKAAVPSAQASKNVSAFGSGHCVGALQKVRESNNREANAAKATQLAEKERLRRKDQAIHSHVSKAPVRPQPLRSSRAGWQLVEDDKLIYLRSSELDFTSVSQQMPGRSEAARKHRFLKLTTSRLIIERRKYWDEVCRRENTRYRKTILRDNEP
jgi:protein subunit release factor B